MKILLTGHLGYIGSVLAPRLLEEGHEVVGLDAGWFRDCRFGSEPVATIPEIVCDLRDLSPETVRGFDAVVHLASLSNDPLGNLDSALTADINTRATLELAEAARRAGVERFVFSSSCSTYGAAGDDFLDESAELHPVTAYGRAKVDVELGLAAMSGDGFSPTYLRNATAYGLSPRLRLDLVLNNLTAWAYTTGRVYLMSDGSPWRPIVHVQDICSAFLAALEAPRSVIHNQAFNVGQTSENYRIRDLADIIADVVPGSRVEMAPGAGPDKRCYRVDCDKIEARLPGYRPEWSARRGAEELYTAFRKADLKPHDLEAPAFFRLGRIEELIEGGRLSADLRWATAA